MLLWFRRGTTLRWGAMLLALALLAPRPSQAAGLGDTLAGWFWTPDQRGARAYAAHRYPEAAEAFADPTWKALALIRAGKYTEGAALLAPIETSAAQYDRGTALLRGRDYQGGVAALERAVTLDPANAEAAHNLAVAKRIVAYLLETREQEDDDNSGEESKPDATVSDLTGDKGKAVRIDAESQLSESSAEQWMRAVETRPADFLKTRFAIEAARPAGTP